MRFIKCYEGEIEGYNTRLKQADKDAKAILDKIQTMRREISKNKRKLANLKQELKEIDTEKLVTAAVWSVDDTWQWFKRKSKEFEVTSDWEIAEIDKWTNGRSRFENVI